MTSYYCKIYNSYIVFLIENPNIASPKIKNRRKNMEQLLTTIGEFVATEINDVEEVEYVDKAMGYMIYIVLKNGEKVLLSLIKN